ncbi:MAG TPA: acetoin utilization protein AcuC [Steroidobacteraceae bacterium]|jgi:acetoin utilization protein AcuC|nr:acetoin utilization protein AcuC [Steroidobacteraceae bacterium]
MNSVAVVVSERLARYGFGDGHPFGPDRLAAFVREFTARGLPQRVTMLEPREASDAELASFHTAEYLEFVRERSASGVGLLDAGDTPAFRGVYEAAAGVVGATLSCMEAIMQGSSRRAFVPIAGLHHAARNRAAGFCVFNDCGVAIEQLKRAGLRHIAYVDIDAHHGDGVFYAFEDDPRVVFADLHEDGRYLYPGTGAASETGRGAAAGMKLNVPLPPGADDEVFASVWPRVLAHLTKYEPEFIILQCGADSLEGDPITHLRFSPQTHGRAARDLKALAESLGHGRVLALGGGGYNRTNLAQAWTAVVENLL